jgi:hypothetical protein
MLISTPLFLVCDGCISRITFILLGLASMPLVDTRQPSTLPHVTPNAHLSRLSLRLASHMLGKVYVRSNMYEALFLLATTMPSTYESTFLPTWSFNAAFIILQNEGPALCSPPQHSHIAIRAKWCYEAGLFFIFLAKLYLMIS